MRVLMGLTDYYRVSQKKVLQASLSLNNFKAIEAISLK